MKRFFPILDWLSDYRSVYLKQDISAGLTVGIMLIPQGMAYAVVAGLPPVYGLYAALVPQLVYAVLGTSKKLSVGPVAMDSLLVAAGIGAMAVKGTEHYITLAISLSLMVGFIQVLLGLLRLGFMVNYLSQPVISGFTSAAAFVIAIGQLENVLGMTMSGHDSVLYLFYTIISRLSEVHFISLLISILTIVFIVVTKRLHSAIPGALVTVVVGIVTVVIFDLDKMGVIIIQDIPSGLPHFQLPHMSFEIVEDLYPIATSLALIAFMEAFTIAKTLEDKKKSSSIDSNQELKGLGLSNVVGAFFMSYPVTGGFSRSAVNHESGAQTPLASIVASFVIAFTLLFLTSFFYYLPKATLGGIILVAVGGLINWKYPLYLYRVNKKEWLMFFITFCITLTIGIKEGIIAGVVSSLLMMIYQTTKPHIATLGQVEGTQEYKNINRFDHAYQQDNILIIRHDGPLYFANSDFFKETITAASEKKGEGLRLLILHSSSLNSVDTSALDVLKRMIQDFDQKGVKVYFTSVIGPVRDFFHQSGFTQELGTDHFFTDIPSAIRCYEDKGDKRDEERIRIALQAHGFEERNV